MKNYGIIVLVLLALLGMEVGSSGQTDGQVPGRPGGITAAAAARPSPQTALEEWALRRGRTIIIRGYTDVGSVQGEDGASVNVLAIEFTDSGGDQRVERTRGLAVRVGSPDAAARGGGWVETFVDEDEIEPLLAALDGLGKLQRGVTRLADFDAVFRSKGGLEIANIDMNGARMASVQAVQTLWPGGEVAWSRTHLRLGRLEEVRRLVAAAQERLNEAAQQNPK